MRALFLSEAEATAYRDACDEAEGLPKPGVPEAPFPYGWTLSWADVTEVEGAWPVPVHGSVAVPSGVQVVADPEVF